MKSGSGHALEEAAGKGVARRFPKRGPLPAGSTAVHQARRALMQAEVGLVLGGLRGFKDVVQALKPEEREGKQAEVTWPKRGLRATVWKVEYPSLSFQT